MLRAFVAATSILNTVASFMRRSAMIFPSRSEIAITILVRDPSGNRIEARVLIGRSFRGIENLHRFRLAQSPSRRIRIHARVRTNQVALRRGLPRLGTGHIRSRENARSNRRRARRLIDGRQRYAAKKYFARSRQRAGQWRKTDRRRACKRGKFRHVRRYSRHADSTHQHRAFINRQAARIHRVRVAVQHIRFSGDDSGARCRQAARSRDEFRASPVPSTMRIRDSCFQFRTNPHFAYRSHRAESACR